MTSLCMGSDSLSPYLKSLSPNITGMYIRLDNTTDAKVVPFIYADQALYAILKEFRDHILVTSQKRQIFVTKKCCFRNFRAIMPHFLRHWQTSCLPIEENNSLGERQSSFTTIYGCGSLLKLILGQSTARGFWFLSRIFSFTSRGPNRGKCFWLTLKRGLIF